MGSKVTDIFNLRKTLFFILIWLFSSNGLLFAQTNSPLSRLDIKNGSRFPELEIFVEIIPKQVKPGSRFTLKIWGRIGNGFYIYSIASQGEFGPEPTVLVINSPYLKAVSELLESDPVIVDDEAFGVPLEVHKNDFTLQQDFVFNTHQAKGSFKISGSILYQICNKKICSFPINRDFDATIQITD